MLTPQGFTETEASQPTANFATNQLMPHSLDAEEALLGALIIDPDQMLDCGYLDKSDFYLLNNGLLYDVMRSLFEKHSAYDWVLITEELRSRAHLEDIGGEAVVADLLRYTPTSYGAVQYADIIYRHSISRQTIQATLSITQSAYQNISGRSGEDLVNGAIDRLSAIEASRNVSNGPQHIKSGINKLYDRFDQILSNNCVAGLQTGIKTLDNIIGGLQDDKFYLLAGRPGMGKSGLALQIAYNVAKRSIPVLLFSLEMSADDIAARLVSSICGVPYESFNRPNLDENVWARINDACTQLEKIPLIIDATPALSVSSIRSIAQKSMLHNPIGLVIIDHGGIVKPSRRTNNQYQDQSANADALMALPKQLGIPVMTLLQLSREVERTTDKRPKMFHLRDTGKWEENADGILFLYRDEVYNPDTEYPHLGEVIIAKNRGGKSDLTIHLAAQVATNRYRDLETRFEPL